MIQENLRARWKVAYKSKWFYEDIISPKNQRNYFKDFCPVSVRAELLKIIASFWGRDDVFIKSFRFLLTFKQAYSCNSQRVIILQ